jgi:dolichol kinase
VIPRDDLRPLVHAATGLVALATGVFPRWLNLAGAVLGVVAGWLVIPRTPLEARLRRPGEPFVGGLRTYPLAVLALVAAFPRAAPAAAAWGVLAFGDAAASLVGRRVPAPRVVPGSKATWSGTGALVAFGAAGAWALSAFVAATGGEPPVPPLWCLLPAVAAALVDLVRIPPDDNLPIAAAAGLTIAAGTGFFG